MLAQRPDADFQGREPAPLTRSEMPAPLNGEQPGQASRPSRARRTGNPAPSHHRPALGLRPCPELSPAPSTLGTVGGLSRFPLVLTVIILRSFEEISPLQQLGEGNGTPLQYSCLENPMDGGAWWAVVHGVARNQTRLSDLTFTFHFHALEKEMATHSSVLA